MSSSCEVGSQDGYESRVGDNSASIIYKALFRMDECSL